MPQVLQVLDISEIWICQFLEFFWPPKVTMTRSKQRAEHDGGEKKHMSVIIDILYILYYML